MIKTAARELEIHRKLYTIVLVHLYITFFIVMSLVSLVETDCRRYQAFESYMKQEGWYMYLFDVSADNGQIIKNSRELESCLRSARVSACYELDGELYSGSEKLSVQMRGYDTDILEAFHPELEKGRWLDEADWETDGIQAVISANRMGIDVGDELKLYGYDRLAEEALTVQIVGVLKEDEPVFDLSLSNDGINYQNFYRTTEAGEPYVLMAYEDVLRAEMQKTGQDELMRLSGNTFVLYEEGITEDDRSYNTEFLSANGMINQREELPSVLQKSRAALQRTLFQYAPAVLMGFLLTAMNSVCVVIILSKKQRRNLAVYHMLGLSWGRCLGIQTITWLLIAGEAFALILITCLFVVLFGLDIYMRPGIWQIFTCICVTALCLGIVALEGLCTAGRRPYTLWRDEQE